MSSPKRPWPFIRPLLMIALFAIALRILGSTLAHYRWHDVMIYLESLPAQPAGDVEGAAAAAAAVAARVPEQGRP